MSELNELECLQSIAYSLRWMMVVLTVIGFNSFRRFNK